MKKEKLIELKKIVFDSYEITADHFNNTRSKEAAPDFKWAASQVMRAGKVFDAGCGNGRLLNYSSIAPENYFGFDQSKSLLNLAKINHPNYNFESGDLSNLDNFKKSYFSTIFCSAVLSHIPGKEERIKVLRSFYDLSLPGGRLIISFWKMKNKYRRQLYRNFWLKITGRYQYDWRDLVFPWKDQRGRKLSARYYYYYSRRRFKKDIISAGWEIQDFYDDRFNFWVLALKK